MDLSIIGRGQPLKQFKINLLRIDASSNTPTRYLTWKPTYSNPPCFHVPAVFEMINLVWFSINYDLYSWIWPISIKKFNLFTKLISSSRSPTCLLLTVLLFLQLCATILHHRSIQLRRIAAVGGWYILLFRSKWLYSRFLPYLEGQVLIWSQLLKKLQGNLSKLWTPQLIFLLFRIVNI